MPVSGASDGSWSSPMSCIGALTCQTATCGNVWFMHIAINGQDFWLSFVGAWSGQHGMSIFIEDCIGIAMDAHDACASGAAIRPSRAPTSRNADRRDRGVTRSA